MTGEWIRFAAASGLLILGVGFMVAAVFGVNRFHHALNRMHAAALGDTLGLLFVILGTITMRGFSMDSLKLAMVIVFFWIASPVCSHMISRLEAMTDESLGEIMVLEKNNGVRVEQTENIKAGEKAVSKKKETEKRGQRKMKLFESILLLSLIVCALSVAFVRDLLTSIIISCPTA